MVRDRSARIGTLAEIDRQDRTRTRRPLTCRCPNVSSTDGFRVFPPMTDLAAPRRLRAIAARIVIALVAALLVLGVAPMPRGGADPIDDQRAEAQRLEAAINDTAAQSAA